MNNTEAARQKNIDLGLSAGVGESVTEWVEYSVQWLLLGAWTDLRVTLDVEKAQAWKKGYEANQTKHVFRVVEKQCKVTP